LVALSAAAFGTLAILGKFALAAGMDAPTILFLRFSMAALLMLALLAARREPLPRGAALLTLVGMGGIGYVGQAMAYLTALQYASAGLVALLLYLYPVFVAILSAVVLHERLSRIKILALGLALLGTTLTVDPQGGQLIGAALAIASGADLLGVYPRRGAGDEAGERLSILGGDFCLRRDRDQFAGGKGGSPVPNHIQRLVGNPGDGAGGDRHPGDYLPGGAESHRRDQRRHGFHAGAGGDGAAGSLVAG
jgi:uncharacterized membrane protein